MAKYPYPLTTDTKDIVHFEHDGNNKLKIFFLGLYFKGNTIVPLRGNYITLRLTLWKNHTWWAILV